MKLTAPSTEAMETAILIDGGFTYDPITGSFIRAGLDDDRSPYGFMISIPGTVFTHLPDAMAAYMNPAFNPSINPAVSDSFKNPVFIGGWYDPEAKTTVFELSELINTDLATATRIATHRNQKAILDIHTGSTIWIG